MKLKHDKQLSNFAYNCNLRHYVKEATRIGGAPPIPASYNISELINAFPYDDWGGCPQLPLDGLGIGRRTPCMSEK